MSDIIKLYGKHVVAEGFKILVDKNRDSLRGTGLICNYCRSKGEYYETLQELADHLTKNHPNAPEWDASEAVLDSESEKDDDAETEKVVDPLERKRDEICFMLDFMQPGIVGAASQQRIAYLLTGGEFIYTGSQTFASQVGYHVNKITSLEKLQQVLDRILLSQKAFNALYD